MYPEKKGGSHKMARSQQNWGLLTLLTRWASIWTMPNTASPKSEPPCGRVVYTPVRATILGHPPQKTAPGGTDGQRDGQTDGRTEWNQYTPQHLHCAGYNNSFQCLQWNLTVNITTICISVIIIIKCIVTYNNNKKQASRSATFGEFFSGPNVLKNHSTFWWQNTSHCPHGTCIIHSLWLI